MKIPTSFVFVFITDLSDSCCPHSERAAKQVVPSLQRSCSQTQGALKFPPTTLTRFVCFGRFSAASCRVQMSRSNKHSFGGWATRQKQSVTGMAWTHMAWFLCTGSHPPPPSFLHIYEWLANKDQGSEQNEEKHIWARAACPLALRKPQSCLTVTRTYLTACYQLSFPT